MASSGIKRVGVVGFDGVGGPWLAEAETPRLRAFFREGAFTTEARTVLPSSSYPAWGSMLTGISPDQHHATEQHQFTAASPCPTWLLRLSQAWGNPPVGVFAAWPPIVGDLLEPEVGATRVQGPDDVLVALFEPYLRHARPRLLFLYLGDPDDVGHAHGYRSPEYWASVQRADRRFGLALEALDESGLAEETLVVTLSDHGGVGKSHGGDSPEELTIFWACRGPGVTRGKQLNTPVSVMDTAAVILAWAGLPLPTEMEGRVPPGVLD